MIASKATAAVRVAHSADLLPGVAHSWYCGKARWCVIAGLELVDDALDGLGYGLAELGGTLMLTHTVYSKVVTALDLSLRTLCTPEQTWRNKSSTPGSPSHVLSCFVESICRERDGMLEAYLIAPRGTQRLRATYRYSWKRLCILQSPKRQQRAGYPGGNGVRSSTARTFPLEAHC